MIRLELLLVIKPLVAPEVLKLSPWQEVAPILLHSKRLILSLAPITRVPDVMGVEKPSVQIAI